MTEPVSAAASELVATMCHWRQDNPGGAPADHARFHFGFGCPYDAMAAVLRGDPDPRLRGVVNLVEDLEAQLRDQAALLDRFAALYVNAGEHSAVNDPWRNALEFLTTLCAVCGVRVAAVQQER